MKRPGMYATCANCGQVVKNDLRGWHGHSCNPQGVLLSADLDLSPATARGFSGKVNTGGTGHKRVSESLLSCELIALHTDLSRWNEFADWEAVNA